MNGAVHAQCGAFRPGETPWGRFWELQGWRQTARRNSRGKIAFGVAPVGAKTAFLSCCRFAYFFFVDCSRAPSILGQVGVQDAPPLPGRWYAEKLGESPFSQWSTKTGWIPLGKWLLKQIWLEKVGSKGSTGYSWGLAQARGSPPGDQDGAQRWPGGRANFQKPQNAILADGNFCK